MWRSKFLISLIIAALILTACGKEPPQPTSTPRPTATATLIPTATPVPPPTATPQVVESLPPGCIGWLKGFKLPVYLCSEDLQTTVLVAPRQCGTVEADQAVKIHFRAYDPQPGQVADWSQVVKQPGETICGSNDRETVMDIWAEYISVTGPTIDVCDQQTNGAYVLVNTVESPVDGWVVIYLADSAEIVSARSVKTGHTDNLQFIFTDRAFLDGAELQALLHADFGERGKFEYPGPDVPLMFQAVKFQLTIGDGELCVDE